MEVSGPGIEVWIGFGHMLDHFESYVGPKIDQNLSLNGKLKIFENVLSENGFQGPHGTLYMDIHGYKQEDAMFRQT